MGGETLLFWVESILFWPFTQLFIAQFGSDAVELLCLQPKVLQSWGTKERDIGQSILMLQSW